MKLFLLILCAIGILACIIWLAFDFFSPSDVGSILFMLMKGILILMLVLGLIVNTRSFTKLPR